MLGDDQRDAARSLRDAYRVESADGVARVTVIATLTDEVGREIRTDAIRLLDEGVRSFIIDFTEMDMIVSSGLGFLVSMNALVSARSARFAVVNTNPNISAVLELTKMSMIVKIVSSRDEALQFLSSQA